MLRNVYFIILTLFVTNLCFGQQRYGNEWYNPSQKYYRINVLTTGAYKLTASQLSSLGIDLSNLDPQKIQLFNNGKEVPVYISGDGDGKLDAQDFLIFYGKTNSGEMDKSLYEKTSFQPNPFYSLYTDTAAYFLTIANATGLRFKNANLSPNGLTSEISVTTESVLDFRDSYYGGAYVIAQTSESEYREGEGFASSVMARGQDRTFQLSTPGQVPNSPVTIGYSVISRSNSSLYTNPRGFNHHFKLELFSSGGPLTVADTSFYSYKLINSSKNISNASLNNSSALKFSIVNDLSTNSDFTDYQATSYFTIKYNRNLNLQGVSALNFTLSSQAPKALLSFENSSLNNPMLFNFGTSEMALGQKTGNNVAFTLNISSTQNELYLFDESQAISATIREVTIPDVATNLDADYIIITNEKLLSSAKEYQKYRNETGHQCLIFTVDNLFNQFFYGLNHPLAIRNFVQYLQDKSPKIKYVLLLGKGVSNSEFRTTAGVNTNLVHTIGFPPSDNMFSAPLYGSNMAPQLAISRVPAVNNEQVLTYLQKLKAYENKGEDINRKTILHISGGNSLGENNSWANYLKEAGKYAENEYAGAKFTVVKKNVTLPITNNLQEKIVSEINKGTDLLTFLGHGSNFSTEINFGEPNELAQNSLITYMINGCLAGNPNTLTTSIGERYLFEPNRGAIGWIATTDEGIASYLAGFAQALYKNSFNKNYGKSVAINLANTVKDYQNPNDILNRMHSRQFNLQGDPAYTFYSPEKPDFYLTNNSVFVKTEKPNTSLDSITIGIIVRNKGKALNDSLKINITRKLKDNSVIDYGVKTLGPVFNTDTVFFTVKMEGERAQGNNVFSVTADADNKFSESDESNNSVSNNIFIPGNGVNLLFPKSNAIVADSKIDLVVQSSDLFSKNNNYLFEVDTVPDFSSGWKKSFAVTANALAKANVAISTLNNQVYFWRSKLDLPADNGSDWQMASFTYQPLLKEGFFQKAGASTVEESTGSVVFNPTLNHFEFPKTAHLISLSTRGDDAPTTSERTFRSSRVGRLAFAGYEFQSLTLVAMSPVTGDFFSFPSVNNFQNYPPVYTGQYFFDPNNPTDVDSLISYINRIPNGYPVVGLNGRNIDLKGMPQRAKDALALLGCIKVNDVSAGEPYLFFGQKGFSPGQATELTADYTSSIPARQQDILMSKEYNPFFNTGNYNSQRIGPAKSWEKAYFSFRQEPNDMLTYQVIPIDKDGKESTALNGGANNEISIANIDANKFPYLKLKAIATDNVERTPPQLINWGVAYHETPENTINLDLPNEFHANQIQQGDSILWKVHYQNISKQKSDSTKVYAVLTNSQRNQTKTLVKTLKPLAPGDAELMSYAASTANLSGLSNIRLEFDAASDNDSYTFNNQLRKDFTVLQDNKEPSMDIAFDGKHIINGEIVSPMPNITIAVKDENQFLLLNDTTALEVSLKQGEDGVYKRVYYSSGKLAFTAATSTLENKADILFKPDKLEDGVYTLKLRSRDKTGNYNTNSDFEISFEVINKSSITNFFPYPNPVVNSMKFVFTLTGTVIPDKIKIQISTMTGKVVREILKSELGDIKIGNNISDFTWDGTDQFGDRLANGVYFYRVFLQDTSTDIKHRNTAGDKYFKNQTGKIYLLR